MQYLSAAGEAVQPELWRWEATYSDGTVLRQFDDETGTFHQFKEIDQSRLVFFRIVSDGNPGGIGFPFIPEAMKLTHYYANTMLSVGTDEETFVRQYVIGYELSVPGMKSSMYVRVSPDGSAVISGEDRPDLFSPAL